MDTMTINQAIENLEVMSKVLGTVANKEGIYKTGWGWYLKNMSNYMYKTSKKMKEDSYLFGEAYWSSIMSKMDYMSEDEEYFYEDESYFLLKKDEEEDDLPNGYSMQSLGLTERDFM